MSIGFQKLEYTLPTDLLHIEELVKEANLSDEILSNMKNGGLEYIPISKEKINVLIEETVEKLKIFDKKNEIDIIIYAQSIPFKIDIFKDIPSITVSGQPCAILHTALKLASTYLNTINSNKSILIIGADKVVSTDERLFFNSAMGDIAIAGLFSKVKIIHQVLSIHVDSYIFATNGELSKETEIANFRENNPILIRNNIETNLQKSNLKLKDIKYIFPHTPYLKIWDLMATVLKYPRESIITNYLNKTGHLNSNDSFFHYLKAIEDKIVKAGDIVLLINPGFGGTRGSTIIQYNGE